MSAFHDDLESLAEAHSLSSTLPHSSVPDSGFLHATIGKMSDVVRAAHAAHVSGDTAKAASLIDPSLEQTGTGWESKGITSGVDSAYHPYPGSAWRLTPEMSLQELGSNVRSVSQHVRRAAPEHAETLERINSLVSGLNSHAYRHHMGMRPADYEDLGMGEDDPHAPLVVKEKAPKKLLEQ